MMMNRLITAIFVLIFSWGLPAQTVDLLSMALPSDSLPAQGDQISISIIMDLSGASAANSELGSFTGSLTWDELVLRYVAHSEIQQGFSGLVNTADALNGEITFNGVNPGGEGGIFDILTVTFDVIGGDSMTTIVDLEYSSLSTPDPFIDLLPLAGIIDANILVVPNPSVLSEVKPSSAFPTTGDIVAVTVALDIDGLSAPLDKLSNITGQIKWNPRELQYLGNSGFKNSFTGQIDASGAASGNLDINGNHSLGIGDNFELLDLTFRVLGNPTSLIKLEADYSSLDAANGGGDLLPYLISKNGFLTLLPGTVNGIQATAILADSLPIAGERMSVIVNLDARDAIPPDTAIGSFTASLNWDPAQLSYVKHCGIMNFLGVVNDMQADAGQLIFNGANADGNSGPTNLLEIEFDVIGSPLATGNLTLAFSNLVSAGNFTDILSQVIANTTNYTILQGFQQDFISQYNLISLPLLPADASVDALYPGSTAGTLVAWDGLEYVNQDSLRFGEGYWIDFPDDRQLTIKGTAVDSLSLTLTEGWQLIGNVSGVSRLTDIIDPGNIIIPNTLYGWDGVYNLTNRLEQGRGYWIRAFNAGQITLVRSQNKFENWPKPSDTIGITDSLASLKFLDAAGHMQILYFNHSTTPLTVEPQSFGLPPKPPAGSFDVRFVDDSRLSLHDNGLISLQAAKFPVAIVSDKFQGQLKVITAFDQDGYDIRHRLNDGGQILISDTQFKFLKYVVQDQPQNSLLPSNFALEQNFPNPFNPATSIRYALPQKVAVKLQVYNTLGQLVQTLVNVEQEAGFYQVNWDATEARGRRVSSGIYFYLLSAGDFRATRKMLLLK